MATPRSLSPEDGSSDSSSVEKLLVDEAATSAPEIIEKVSVIPADDITKASGDEILEDKEESPAPEIINPRAYQREMLEQSLERNVIVAVSSLSPMFCTIWLTLRRWTRVVGKPKCKASSRCSQDLVIDYSQSRSSHSS